MTRRTTETFKKDLILKGFLGACVGVFAFPRIGRVLLRNTRMTSFVNEHFSFSPANPTRIHTRITYAFNHANATHLVFNAAMLWMLGKELVFDPRVNSAHLTTLMTVSAASASFAESSLFATTGSFSRPMVGASGIAMGFLGALAVLDPNKTWLMMFPIPGLTLTSHQMVQATFATHVAAILWKWRSNNPSRIALKGHLGGLVAGYLLAKLLTPESREPAWTDSYFHASTQKRTFRIGPTGHY